MQIATIILDWNQPILTLNTINSVQNCDLPKKIKNKIYLVENGSSKDNVQQIIDNCSKDIKIIVTPENYGFCKGNNVAIKDALDGGANYILLINNDTRIDRKAIKYLLKKLRSKTKTGAVSPKIYFEKGYEYYKEKYSDKQKGKVIWALGGKIDWNNVYGSNISIDEVDSNKIKIPQNPDFLSGCCMLIKANVLKSIGQFDENYYLYLEDADLSQRILKSGHQLAIEPKAKLWHINSGSSGAKSDLHLYFMTRNRLYFASKYSSIRTQFALFRESITKYLTSHHKFEKKAIKDFYLSKMGKGTWT